jgi:hypothetical protein
MVFQRIAVEGGSSSTRGGEKSPTFFNSVKETNRNVVHVRQNPGQLVVLISYVPYPVGKESCSIPVLATLYHIVVGSCPCISMTVEALLHAALSLIAFE